MLDLILTENEPTLGACACGLVNEIDIIYTVLQIIIVLPHMWKKHCNTYINGRERLRLDQTEAFGFISELD